MQIQGNQLVPELLLTLSDLCIYHVDILSLGMKKCHAKKNIFYSRALKKGGYTGFALSFRNSVIQSFCHLS